MFDTGYADNGADEVNTVELTGKKITKILSKCDDDGAFNDLRFEHENGTQTIFNKGSTYGTEQTREIPQDH